MATSKAAAKGPTHGKDKGAHKEGAKRVSKPSLSLEERLQRLFTSLCAQIDGGHFSNAIRTCEKILRLEPNDEDAMKTKLFLLLQTEQYDAALTLIDQNKQHAFERAYSHYRLNDEAEARRILREITESNDGDDRSVIHLEAQLNYREGSYEAAVELYSGLLETADPDSEEHFDILTNLQAAQQHLNFIKTGFLQALDALPTSVTTTMKSNPPPAQQQPSHLSAASIASGTPAAVAAPTAPAEKKARRSRVPPGVVPGVTPPPDPERWLKKSERSTYGQGRRRRGQGGGGATQGISNVENVPLPSHPNQNKPAGGKGKKRK